MTTSECTSVLAEVEHTKTCLETLNAQLEEMESQAQTMEKLNERLQNALNLTVDQYNDLASHTNYLQRENHRLRELLVETNAEKLTHLAISSSSFDLMQQVKEEQLKLHTDQITEKYKMKLHHLEGQIRAAKQYHEKNHGLQQGLVQAIDSQKYLATKFLGFKEEMNDMLEEMASKMTRSNMKLSQVIDEKEAVIQELNQALAASQKLNAEHEHHVRRLASDLENLRKQHSTHQDKLRKKEDELGYKEKSIGAYQDQFVDMVNKLEALKQKVADYAQSEARANSAMKELSRVVTDQKCINDKLEELIEEKDREVSDSVIVHCLQYPDTIAADRRRLCSTRRSF
jgi:chromosome segregation ATPase